MTGTQDIIIVKQLPIVEEQFLALEKQIKEQLSVIDSLEISDEKKAEIKKLRAEFNKDSAFYAERLKEVKNQITAPYLAIEKLFKEHISTPYAEADTYLKKAVDDIESEQKKQIHDELRAYYEEYQKSLGLTFPSYEQANFKIGVSSTLKRMKEQAKMLLNDVYEAVRSTQTLTYADEVMIEYKTSLNLPQSIQIVEDRHIRLAAVEREKEQLLLFEVKNAETAAKVEELTKSAEISAPSTEAIQNVDPKPTEEKVRTVRFGAEGTIEQLKRFKQRIVQCASEEGVKLI